MCNYELVEDILHLVNNRNKQRPDTDQTEPDEGLIMGHFTDPNWLHIRKVTGSPFLSTYFCFLNCIILESYTLYFFLKVIYQALKSYGAVSLELEGVIQSEVEDLIDAISKIGGHPVQPSHMVNITVCSIISSLVVYQCSKVAELNFFFSSSSMTCYVIFDCRCLARS